MMIIKQCLHNLLVQFKSFSFHQHLNFVFLLDEGYTSCNYTDINNDQPIIQEQYLGLPSASLSDTDSNSNTASASASAVSPSQYLMVPSSPSSLYTAAPSRPIDQNNQYVELELR
jgi:hypothetical protein